MLAVSLDVRMENPPVRSAGAIRPQTARKLDGQEPKQVVELQVILSFKQRRNRLLRDEMSDILPLKPHWDVSVKHAPPGSEMEQLQI